MSDSGKRISCVITSYNKRYLLPRAIKSVLAQDRPIHEIIIVDDNPANPCEDIIKEYADAAYPVVYVKQTHNAGVLSARNIGVEKSSGDFIAFLDEDDYWHPKKLSSQIAVAHEYGFVGCLAAIVKSGQVNNQKSNCDAETFLLQESDIFESTRFLFPSGILISRIVFSYLGGFDIRTVENDFFYKAALKASPICIVNEPLCFFDREERQETRQSATFEAFKGQAAAFFMYYRNFSKDRRQRLRVDLCYNEFLYERNLIRKALWFALTIFYSPRIAAIKVRRALGKILKKMSLKR